MPARMFRRHLAHHPPHHELRWWAWVVGGLVAIWLLLSSAAAGQGRQPTLLFPAFPGGKLPAELTPDKVLETLLGKDRDFDNEELLGKIEVSWTEEMKLGQQSIEDLRRQLAGKKQSLIERGKDAQYLERLVGLLQPQMKQAERYKKVHVYVTSLGAPNACSFPGGHLVVSREMLDQAGSEAALIGVLGHELAHLDRGHLLRRMKQWKLAQDRLANPPAGFSWDSLLGNMTLMQRLFRRPFGPAEELDADTDGITWAYHAGYDPLELGQVYTAMEAAGLSAPSFLPSFLRTHPFAADRRDHLLSIYNSLQTADPQPHLYLGRQNLMRRLTRQQREFAD